MPYPGVNIPAPTTPEADYWLTAGIAVFHGSTAAADFPPLDAPQAQRYWLGGFGAAWAECPRDADGWCAQPLDVALMLALVGRGELLAQVCSGHGSPMCTMH
ncbi:MAG: histidine kinase [Thiohalocapsa sp.]|uniref:histidine kinase n=1 Tax=Thiohalocapsa sp. TaxID=2497641 RepID=UPI0025F3CC0A|nr:histidine kinase [Thiohalocapsa sp.]MCG6940526.1 histidine kinase [Thiohalocapsa sp.]